MDGSYNDWLVWIMCLMFCGGGVKYRYRNCINLIFMYGGRDCFLIGLVMESDSCYSEFCLGMCLIFIRIIYFFYIFVICVVFW